MSHVCAVFNLHGRALLAARQSAPDKHRGDVRVASRGQESVSVASRVCNPPDKAMYQLRPAVTFQVKQLRPRLLRVSVSVASRGQFSGITVVYQAAEEKPNDSSVE
jgi:hypothetical protein